MSLIGSARVTACDGSEVALPHKAHLLTAFLALACQGHVASRSEVARFLWPDAPRSQASANLRQLLSRIRKVQEASGLALIAVTASQLRLANDAWIDVLALEQLVAEPSWAGLPEMLDLYGGGQLLSAISMEEELREWVAGWRDQLRERFVSAVVGLLGGVELAGHARQALVAARRVLELEPYHEPALRVLMRAYAAEGRPHEARRAFEYARAQVKQDLGVELTTETVETLDALLGGSVPGQDEIEERPQQRPNAAAAANDDSRPEVSAGVPKIAILLPAREAASDDLHGIAVSLLEDVMLGLCSLRTIDVIAPHTSWQLSANPMIQSSVEQFDITYLVESNLRVLHGSNALSLKLLDARSRAIMWAQRVPLGNLQLATSYREICFGLVPSISDALERAEIKRAESANARAAYYWYLQGQRHLRHIDLPNIRRARRAFNAAIATGAEFAPAYSGAARTLQMEWILLARGDHAALAESEELARRAIDLDPRDSGGYHQLGFASLYSHRFDESIAHFTQAERRHPQHADLLADFADALAHSGRPAVGLKKLDQAMALNPIVPDKYWWQASGMNYQLHRYDEAINCALRMKDGSPAWRLLAASYAKMGDNASAREYVEKTLETYPDFRVEHWLSIVPNRNPDDIRHYKEGLRAAGFP